MNPPEIITNSKRKELKMIRLVPTPKKHTFIDETYHLLKPVIHSNVEKWNRYLSAFTKAFRKLFDFELCQGIGGAELVLDESLASNAYTINSDENGVMLCASSDEGILYALSSYLQLINTTKGQLSIQYFTIEDKPDKEYRAFMVDMGRLWHPFDKLLKFVDICFLFKIKYLHLHFIDTGVYSLPSKTFPKLPTEGEHYTFEEIEELNQYAKDKGIILIPEYECPGHASQFTKKYPEIFLDTIEGDVGEEYRNESGEIIANNNIICAGSEKAWEATKSLLKEICDMFPDSPYINIGGDEAKISVWDHCSVCKKYMHDHGITDSKELYSEYVARVTSYILTLGKTPIVWEGFPKKGCERIPKETIVVAWESYYNLPQDLLDSGFRVINSSWQPLYIVPSVTKRWNPIDILNWNVYNWQNWFEKSEAFLNPINVAPTNQVIGAMLCAWEQTYEQEIHFSIENLSAMSEKVWNVKRVCNDKEFLAKQAPLIYLAALIIRDR